MSAIFNGTSSFLKTLTAIAAGEPLMLFYWMKPANTTAVLTPWTMSNSGSTNNYYQHTLRGDTTDAVNFNWRGGGTAVSAQSGGTFSADAWQAVGGLILADDLGYVYLNGTRGGIVNGTSQNPTGLDCVTIGSYLSNDSPSQFFAGRLAYVTVWSGKGLLKAGEPRLSAYQAEMANGRNPLTCYPESLRSCLQLTSRQSMTGDVGAEVYANTDVAFDGADNPTVSAGPSYFGKHIPWNHPYHGGIVQLSHDAPAVPRRVLGERV